MTIGHLYYLSLSIIVSSFLCMSHYNPWPSDGYNLKKSTGNVFRKQQRAQAEAEREELKKVRKEQREKRRRERRYGGRKQEGPERVANFDGKSRRGSRPRSGSRPIYNTRDERERGGGDGKQQHRDSKQPSQSDKRNGSAHATQRSHGSRPSGSITEHQHTYSNIKRDSAVPEPQQPDIIPKRNGNIANGYVPYAYIYGDGPVTSNGGQHFRSPTDYSGSPDVHIISPGSRVRSGDRYGSPPAGTVRAPNGTFYAHGAPARRDESGSRSRSQRGQQNGNQQ